jgi:hypothetical protein
MTKEKARIVAFNYTASRWEKFWIRRAIAKHTELMPLLVEFNSKPEFVMVIQLGKDHVMVAKSFSTWFKTGEVIDRYRWRESVVVTKEDIV